MCECDGREVMWLEISGVMKVSIDRLLVPFFDPALLGLSEQELILPVDRSPLKQVYQF